MTLDEYLATPAADGKRRRKRDFAAKINVHQTMITEYAAGRAWPSRDRFIAIVRETNGQVSPLDWLPDHCRQMVLERLQAAAP